MILCINTLSKLDLSLGKIGTGAGGPGAVPRQYPNLYYKAIIRLQT